MESILDSVKKKIGITEDYTEFDDGQIIDYINSVFFNLRQLGIGPAEGFFIVDEQANWEDYIPVSPLQRAVRVYVGNKIQLRFDPPQSSSALEVLKNDIAEFEWRFTVEDSV